MDANELRALAEALLPMAAAPCFDGIDIERAADYLRAQADAQPVAVPAGWKWVPVEPTPEMLSAVGMMDGYDWHAPGCSPDADHANWYSAMIAAAPAAPQAEPTRDWSAIDAAIREYLDGYEQIGENDAGADACYTPTERERDLIYDAINGLLADESFVAAISAPQAEPKRNQPLLDLLAVIHCDGGDHTEAVGIEQSIKDAQDAVCMLKGKLAQAEPKREPLSDERIAEIQRAAYERAEQVCIETAAELRRCADGCTDGRYDWKADGADDCADAIHALGRQ